MPNKIDLDEFTLDKPVTQYLVPGDPTKKGTYRRLKVVTKAGQPVKKNPAVWLGSNFCPKNTPDGAKFKVTIEQIS